MKKLNLVGKKYTVKIEKTDEPDHCGEYCDEKKRISINPKFERKTHTLGHEIGHIFWREIGLDQVAGLSKFEEPFCQLMGSLIEDNIVTLYQMHTKLSLKQKK
jgi:hypothetical protein